MLSSTLCSRVAVVQLVSGHESVGAAEWGEARFESGRPAPVTVRCRAQVHVLSLRSDWLLPPQWVSED